MERGHRRSIEDRRGDQAAPLRARAAAVPAERADALHRRGHERRADADLRRQPGPKHEAAEGIVLFRAIAAAPVNDIEDAQFYRMFTTSPMPVFFESADRAKIATYFARWIGRRGDMSTPSAPVSMAIAA